MDILQLSSPGLFAGPYAFYTAAGIALALVVYLCVNEIVRNRSRIAGFGGPRGLPLVGNLLHVQDYSAQKYQEWAKTYGDVYQVQLGNTTILLINSAAAAKKFFITNSHTFSSRPVTYTFGRVSPKDVFRAFFGGLRARQVSPNRPGPFSESHPPGLPS